MKVILIDDEGKEVEYKEFILYGVSEDKIQRVTNDVSISDMCITKEWLQSRIIKLIEKNDKE